MCECLHRYFRKTEDALNVLVEKQLVQSQVHSALAKIFLSFYILQINVKTLITKMARFGITLAITVVLIILFQGGKESSFQL